jgi:hypothetical protein
LHITPSRYVNRGRATGVDVTGVAAVTAPHPGPDVAVVATEAKKVGSVARSTSVATTRR